jgi:hypothetical protein
MENRLALKLEERLNEIEARRVEIRAMLETDDDVDLDALEKRIKGARSRRKEVKSSH